MDSLDSTVSHSGLFLCVWPLLVLQLSLVQYDTHGTDGSDFIYSTASPWASEDQAFLPSWEKTTSSVFTRP